MASSTGAAVGESLSGRRAQDPVAPRQTAEGKPLSGRRAQNRVVPCQLTVGKSQRGQRAQTWVSPRASQVPERPESAQGRVDVRQLTTKQFVSEFVDDMPEEVFLHQAR